MRPTFRGSVRLLVGSALAVGAWLTAVWVWQGPGVGWDALAPLAGVIRQPAAAGVFAALVVLAAFEWRLVQALARAKVHRAGPRRRDRGTAMIEFAMLFPIMVMVLMIIVQLSLLMQGNVVVNYAAYAATRSAVVQIPLDLSYFGEGRNEMGGDLSSRKMRRIHRSAVLAATPISGRLPPSGTAQDIEGDLRLIYVRSGEPARAGLGGAFARKFTYANERTRIVDVGPRQGDGTFGRLQPVRVVIQHDLELGVPFARAIFADGSFRDAEGGTHYYTTVEAHYRLTNEGPRPEPLEPYCPRPPPPPPRPHPWRPPPSGCPYHQ